MPEEDLHLPDGVRLQRRCGGSIAALPRDPPLARRLSRRSHQLGRQQPVYSATSAAPRSVIVACRAGRQVPCLFKEYVAGRPAGPHQILRNP